MKRLSFIKATRYIAIITILIGLIVYIICVLYTSNPNIMEGPITSSVLSDTVCTILEGVSISLIAGAIVSILLDMPSRIDDYKESILAMLLSDKYVENLKKQDLERLHRRIVSQMHKEVVPRMAKGLIDIELNICKLLQKPFYEYYRQHVCCEKEENGYIEKTNHIEYKLVNPYGNSVPIKDKIKIRSWVLKGEKTKDEILKNIHISYSIDSQKEENISDKIMVREEPLTEKSQYYDSRFFVEKTDKNRSYEDAGYDVEFCDFLIVKLTYTIVVPQKDTTFTKRLLYPTKSLRLDFLSKDENVKLYGQIFGTQIKQSDISEKCQKDNIISLESFNWLLPQNGAVIVMCKK